MSALIDWDRLPTETPKSYAAFLAYVALGARRSVREAARQYHSNTLWDRSAVNGHWVRATRPRLARDSGGRRAPATPATADRTAPRAAAARAAECAARGPLSEPGGRDTSSRNTPPVRTGTDRTRIAGLLFMGGLRRSEVAAVRWADVTDASDGDGVLLTVRTSKTNHEGDAADVRYLKNGGAKAIRTVRADRPDAAPTDRVVGLSPVQIQRRFTAAARAAGIEARVTAHSGRVGLASELTARGASTTEVMLAGNWKTARMVAHYSAGATAERGAVRKYL